MTAAEHIRRLWRRKKTQPYTLKHTLTRAMQGELHFVWQSFLKFLADPLWIAVCTAVRLAQPREVRTQYCIL